MTVFIIIVDSLELHQIVICYSALLNNYFVPAITLPMVIFLQEHLVLEYSDWLALVALIYLDPSLDT